MRKIAVGFVLIMFALSASAHLWFSTVSDDSIAADTTEEVYSSGLKKLRLREITFTFDQIDSTTSAANLGGSKIILVFNGDSSTTTFDTVYNYYAAGKADAQVPGMFRIFTYDTTTGTVAGKLTGMNFPLDSLKIGIFNEDSIQATFKAGIIWEDVYYR